MSELTGDEAFEVLIDGIKRDYIFRRVLAEVTRDMARTEKWKNKEVELMAQSYLDSFDEARDEK